MSGAGDRIVLEGMQFHGYHGNTAAERDLGNRFTVDIELRLDLSPAGHSDDLADTVDYAHVYETIRAIVEERRFNLLEAIAEAIAGALLTEPRVLAVLVRVAKPPPLPGIVLRSMVVIERSRMGTG